MALAEARAIWQRTANRCFVQEKDSKRAPKLACNCSSVSPSAKQTDASPASAFSGQHIPNTVSFPFNPNLSYSNLSPNSKWWLRLQIYCAYKKDLMDGQFNPVEVNDMESLKLQVGEDVGCEVSKNGNELYFDHESSWIRGERNITPWWRTADTDELASFVAQRSLEHIENCDLPMPQNTRIRISSVDKSLRDIPTPMHTASNAQLMEALRHSQTRERSRDSSETGSC